MRLFSDLALVKFHLQFYFISGHLESCGTFIEAKTRRNKIKQKPFFYKHTRICMAPCFSWTKKKNKKLLQILEGFFILETRSGSESNPGKNRTIVPDKEFQKLNMPHAKDNTGSHLCEGPFCLP